jgi:hypothetical protein
MRRLLVLIAAVALAASFTVPAMAAEKEVSFYGRVWMDTFMKDRSKELTGYNDSDSDLLWNLQENGTSRFGANFKWDSMSANIEIRPWSASMYRQWWGAWNFGAGSLLVGHTWSPLYINATICAQCAEGGSAGGYGFWVGDLRRAQIRLTTGGLTVALVEPSASDQVLPAYTAPSVANVGGVPTAVPASGYQTDIDTTLPKIEATYALTVGPVSLVPFLGWQTYDVEDLATGKDYSIDGMVYGLTVKYPIGPGYVNGQIWFTQNGAQWGDLYYTGSFGGAQFDGTSIVDEDGMGYGIEAGMALSETMKLAVGYGHVEYELDTTATNEDPASSMYAQLEIQIAPGFWVTPEFGVIDDKEITGPGGFKVEEGDMTYYGAVWKIHF